MKDWFVRVLLLAGIIFSFFYFLAVSVSESDGYKKLRIETKSSGTGYVIRMKPQGWEIWKLEKRVERFQLVPVPET